MTESNTGLSRHDPSEGRVYAMVVSRGTGAKARVAVVVMAMLATSVGVAAAVSGNATAAGTSTYVEWGDFGVVDNVNQLPRVVNAPAGRRFVEIDEGGYHSLAIDEQGAVWSRGSNRHGERGDGTVSSIDDAFTSVWAPVTVIPAGVHIVHVSASSYVASDGSSVAVDSNGQVWTWGTDAVGQLGDGGSAEFPAEPVVAEHPQLPAGIKIVAVAAGDYHTIALDDQGRVWGWGLNGSGELGVATGVGYISSVAPVMTEGLADIVSIAAGNQFSAALGADGRVSIWGYPYGLVLGTAFPATMGTPVHPDGLEGVTVTAISAGDQYMMALDSNGHVWTWGVTTLGRPIVTQADCVPTMLSIDQGGSPVVIGAIEAGSMTAAAVDLTGQVWTWGSNGGSEAGVPLVSEVATPGLIDVTNLPAGTKVSRVALGHNTVSALPTTFTADAPPPSGTVGQVYAGYRFAAIGLGTMTYSVASGSLPPGLSLSSAGALSGTPTVAGDFTFTASITDESGQNATSASITIHIAASPAPVAPLFVASSPPLTATVGVGYGGYQFVASGDAPISFSVSSGSLPPGLVLSSVGVLSGTPTAVGSSSFVVRASNGAGFVDTGSITIVVSAAPPQRTDLRVTITRPATVGFGDGFNAVVTVTNRGPAAATATSVRIVADRRLLLGALPTGCTLSGAQANGDRIVQCALGTVPLAGTAQLQLGVRATVPSANGVTCTIYGTSGNDILTGTPGADRICGLGGSDTISAGDGNDTVYGDVPPGTANYAASVSAVVSSSLADLAPADNSAAATTAVGPGSPGNDILRGEAGDDHLYGQSGDDRATGGTGDDTVVAGAGSDVASGGDGDDTIEGDAGDDFLGGDAGVDTIDGNAGNDVLHGGSAAPRRPNLLNGGAGQDCASNGPDLRSSIETVGVCANPPP